MRARLWVAAGVVLAAAATGAALVAGGRGEQPPSTAPSGAPPRPLEIKTLRPTSRKEVDRRARVFMDLVYRDLVEYWAPKTVADGYGRPRIKRVWPRRGKRVRTACGLRADQDSAFYCPADDTIYVGQRLASEIWRNEIFPARRGAEPPLSRKRGDMGLAFVVAHEYSHGIEELIGARSYNPTDPTRAFELAADCAAGVWGRWVNSKRKIPAKSLAVAWTTARQVGDTSFADPDHHGTPAQRRNAWDAGFHARSITRCSSYLSLGVPRPISP